MKQALLVAGMLFIGLAAPTGQAQTAAPAAKRKPEFVKPSEMFRGVGSIRVEVWATGTAKGYGLAVESRVKDVLGASNLLGGDSAPGRLLIVIGAAADGDFPNTDLFYVAARFARIGLVQPVDQSLDAYSTLWEQRFFSIIERENLRTALIANAIKFSNQLLEAHAAANAGYKGEKLPNETRKPVTPEESIKGVKAVKVRAAVSPGAQTLFTTPQFQSRVEAAFRSAGIEVTTPRAVDVLATISGYQAGARIIWLAEIQVVPLSFFDPLPTAGNVLYVSAGVTARRYTVGADRSNSLAAARNSVDEMVKDLAKDMLGR